MDILAFRQTKPLQYVGILLILLGIFTVPTNSSRILVIPHQALSHVGYFVKISEPLIQRGHEVYGVMNGACTQAVESLEQVGVKVVPFYLKDKSCFSEGKNSGDWILELFRSKDAKEDQKEVLKEYSKLTLATNKDILEEGYVNKLRTLNIDLCINDGFGFAFFTYILPYRLDLPYVSLVTIYFPTLIGIPGLMSFTPSILSQFSDKMSFLERMESTIYTLWLNNFMQNLAGSDDALVAQYAPDKPAIPILDLVRQTKLWLLNTDPVLDYPRVTLPHVIGVGGLSTKPGKPLPESLQTIMDESKNGVILLSFGSLVKKLPVDVTGKIFEALSQMMEYTVIMKYNGPKIEGVPGHMHLLPWLPQNDILAHPGVKLFITHCGNNGQFESLYHSVPMLGLPIFGDQLYNAHRMSVKQFGLAMKMTDFTTHELVSNIREILANSTYSQNIQKASRIYRSHSQTATEKAVYWIEHVLEHGAEHLLSEATKLPWYQYWLVDVAIFLLVMATLCLLTLLMLGRVLYKVLYQSAKKVKKS